jgi:hypothetical protein
MYTPLSFCVSRETIKFFSFSLLLFPAHDQIHQSAVLRLVWLVGKFDGLGYQVACQFVGVCIDDIHCDVVGQPSN